MEPSRQRPRRALPGAGFLLLVACLSGAADDAPPPEPPAATTQPTTVPAEPIAPAPAAAPKFPAHFRSKANGARPEPDPPEYVRPMSEHGRNYGIDAFNELDWLDFGLEHRTRFELRDDDYRQPELVRDEQFLMRTRAYLGVREIIDPFRFAIEFQDSRQFASQFPESNRDVDENDILQAFGELYFKDALGPGHPLSLRVGRMTLESVDRKIVARNRWRNTTNAFDGFRIQLGQPSADWQFDFFAVMPVERRLRQPDRSDEEQWLYGLVGSWRRWSEIVTLEPYYFILDQDSKDPDTLDLEIHTMGLHAFGPIGKTRFDYDLDVAFQFGDNGPGSQCAFAGYGELGYTFDHKWKPRLSFATTYATGDRDPDDADNERFNRIFGANHYRSTLDLFTWQNVISPKLRIELTPHEKLRLDASYGVYWLASDTDAWVVPNRRDPTGKSGDFVGHEFDVRARYQLNRNAELETGYAYFIPGDFVQNTGPADDSDFFYVQLTLKF